MRNGHNRRVLDEEEESWREAFARRFQQLEIQKPRPMAIKWQSGWAERDFLLANKWCPSANQLPTFQARYFIMKSFSMEDLIQSIIYGYWASTQHGSHRISRAFQAQSQRPIPQAEGRPASPTSPIYLFFSANASGRYQGVARLLSDMDWSLDLHDIWHQDAAQLWKGGMRVQWVVVKDVPMRRFAQLRNPLNQGRPVPVSRDAQEVEGLLGAEMLRSIVEEPYRESLAGQVMKRMSSLPRYAQARMSA